MSEILGYDIDGKPLRAGDRVVMVSSPNPLTARYIGRVFEITGLSFVHADSVTISERLNGRRASLVCETVRKLPPKQDTTTWEAIQEMTGWSPVAQPARPC